MSGGNESASGQSVAFWIDHLRLQRHPEGGYYRRTYRSAEEIPASALPSRYDGARAFGTAIYFLLEAGEVSALHRLRSDEMWYFHSGGTLLIHAIEPDGTLHTQRLGSNLERGDQLQACMLRGPWFGAELDGGAAFALMSCTVSPGFDFADFELARRQELLVEYPQHRALIERLTRS